MWIKPQNRISIIWQLAFRQVREGCETRAKAHRRWGVTLLLALGSWEGLGIPARTCGILWQSWGFPARTCAPAKSKIPRSLPAPQAHPLNLKSLGACPAKSEIPRGLPAPRAPPLNLKSLSICLLLLLDFYAESHLRWAISISKGHEELNEWRVNV